MAVRRTKGDHGVGEQVALVGIWSVVTLAALAVAVVLSHTTKSDWWYALPVATLTVAVAMVIRAIAYKWLGWDRNDADGVRVGPEGPPERIDEQVFRECEVMAAFALSSGLAVPGRVLQTIGDLARLYPKGPRTSPAPPDITARPDAGTELRRLGLAHRQLARIVAPANPRSLRILKEGSYNQVLACLGRVRLVRNLIYVAFFLIAAFIGLAMRADFSDAKGVFGTTGKHQIYNALELVAAAGLGAVFYGLYRANYYVTKNNYDPKYEASYWIRFTLGIVGGVLLAVVLPANGNLAKPVLALLGGFSAKAVYTLMVRLVDTIENLVDGSSAQSDAARTEAASSPLQPHETDLAEWAQLDQDLHGNPDPPDPPDPPDQPHPPNANGKADLVVETVGAVVKPPQRP